MILLVQRIKNFVVHIMSLHHLQKIWLCKFLFCLIPFYRFLISLRIHGKTTHMRWLWLVGSLKIWVSFAEYSLFYRALLHKRQVFLGILLIVPAHTYHCRITLSHYNCPIAIKITLNISGGHFWCVCIYSRCYGGISTWRVMAHVNKPWHMWMSRGKSTNLMRVRIYSSLKQHRKLMFLHLDVSSLLQNITSMQHLSYIHIDVVVHFVVHFETGLKFRVTAKRN